MDDNSGDMPSFRLVTIWQRLDFWNLWKPVQPKAKCYSIRYGALQPLSTFNFSDPTFLSLPASTLPPSIFQLKHVEQR